jgi:hypothetical protein
MSVRYPAIPKEESRRVRVAIRHVFLEVWDPIGVKDAPEARDEYDGYIGRVFELLVTGGNDQEIIDYLEWAVGHMGMDGSRVNLQTVVLALRQIDLPSPELSNPPS